MLAVLFWPCSPPACPLFPFYLCLPCRLLPLFRQDFFYEPIVGLSRSPFGFATGLFKVIDGGVTDSKHSMPQMVCGSVARRRA